MNPASSPVHSFRSFYTQCVQGHVIHRSICHTQCHTPLCDIIHTVFKGLLCTTLCDIIYSVLCLIMYSCIKYYTQSNVPYYTQYYPLIYTVLCILYTMYKALLCTAVLGPGGRHYPKRLMYYMNK